MKNKSQPNKLLAGEVSKETVDRKKRAIIASLFSVSMALLATFLFFNMSKDAFGQQTSSRSRENYSETKGRSNDQGGPGQDMGFPGGPSERVRPPRPTKTKEDNHYPAGFLTLSKPQDASAPQPTPAKEEPANLPQPVIPTVDYPPIDDLEPNFEEIPRKDPTYVFGILLAAGLFGLFAFFDYRNRIWIQNVVMENNRLLASDATSADFADLLYGSPSYTMETGSAVAYDLYSNGLNSFLGGSYSDSVPVGSSLLDTSLID
ncbi:MAG: hypothetical protein Q4F84_07995, partial [Fibrobacter sp.]|nr:hypothetical protein [Fibrobacter sp.]